MPTCIDRGILKVEEMLIQNRILTFPEFTVKYGVFPRSVLDYNLLSNALKVTINNLDSFPTAYSCCSINLKTQNLNRKYFYRYMYQPTAPNCVALWQRKYAITINNNYWELIHHLKEPRLVTLCWKIVQNIYPTNILLFKMKISSSDECKFCHTKDFIEHFFVHCKRVLPLWHEITKDIFSISGVPVALDESKILLGVPQIRGVSAVIMKKINLVIAVGKLTISKFKYGKPRNILEIYETECHLRNITRC